MDEVRTVLVTSARSGVGRALADAARLSRHTYRLIGLDAGAAGDGMIRVPPTQCRAEFASAVTAVAGDAPPSLILPGRDPDVQALADMAPDLAACGATFPSGPAAAVTASIDKAGTADGLGLAGLFVPTASTVDGALRIAGRTGWPLVVKPRCGSASRGVRLVDGAHELAATMTADDIAQEYLPLLDCDRRPWDGTDVGGQDGEYSVQLVLGPLSRFAGCFAARHRLSDGRPVVVEVLGRTVEKPLLSALLPALQQVNATGCWNFQGRMTDRGVRFFEVNARTTGITGLRASLGFNELDLLYEAFVLRRPVSAPRTVPAVVVDATQWTAPPPVPARAALRSPTGSAQHHH